VEHQGSRHEIDAFVALPSLSADGKRLAYVQVDRETNSGPVMILDLETGEREILAEDLDPCACDATPPLEWSPSGRFLTYSDFGGVYDLKPGEEPEDAGSYVIDLQAGTVVRASRSPRGLAVPAWLPGSDSLVVAREGQVVLLDPGTGEETVLWGTDRRLDSVRIDPSGMLVLVIESHGPPWKSRTVAIDVHSRQQVGEWGDGHVEAAWTQAGPAAAIRPTGDRTSTCVDYPAPNPFPECLGSVSTAWSPTGRFLAVGEDGQVRLFDFETGTERTIDIGPAGYPDLRWNANGTHLLVSWGLGL
jgi:WD40 repeat protein